MFDVVKISLDTVAAVVTDLSILSNTFVRQLFLTLEYKAYARYQSCNKAYLGAREPLFNLFVIK